MRFSSSLKSGRSFYTDQSGLGVIRRDWVEELSLSGNHFPVTQAAYLQAQGHRLSLVVDHATGASSVQEGALEVMVDRRTMYDDARGMGEGVTDSRATTHGYWLLLETRDPGSTPTPDTLAALSPLATVLSRHLDNPVTVLTAQSSVHQPTLSLLKSPLPCDYNLVNLRSWAPSESKVKAIMILQRSGPDCGWASLTLSDCVSPAPSPSISWTHSLFTKYSPVTLTGNFDRPSDSRSVFTLSPMELAAYNVTFS